MTGCLLLALQLGAADHASGALVQVFRRRDQATRSPSGPAPWSPAASTTSPPPAHTAWRPVCRRRLTNPDHKGYQGAGIGVHSPVKGHNLHVSNTSYNMLLTALRALGERANAELKQRWKCLRRIRVCPSRIGDIVAAGIVLSTLQRGNY